MCIVDRLGTIFLKATSLVRYPINFGDGLVVQEDVAGTPEKSDLMCSLARR